MNESNGSSGRSATDRSGSGAVVGTFEALHGEAGQLLQVAEVFEGVGERREAALFEEPAQARLDARSLAK